MLLLFLLLLLLLLLVVVVVLSSCCCFAKFLSRADTCTCVFLRTLTGVEDRYLVTMDASDLQRELDIHGRTFENTVYELEFLDSVQRVLPRCLQWHPCALAKLCSSIRWLLCCGTPYNTHTSMFTNFAPLMRLRSKRHRDFVQFVENGRSQKS